MQATYSTNDLAWLVRAEHERAIREAYFAKLERGDGVSFVERTVQTLQQTRALAAAGLAAAAIIAGAIAIH